MVSADKSAPTKPGVSLANNAMSRPSDNRMPGGPASRRCDLRRCPRSRVHDDCRAVLRGYAPRGLLSQGKWPWLHATSQRGGDCCHNANFRTRGGGIQTCNFGPQKQQFLCDPVARHVTSGERAIPSYFEIPKSSRHQDNKNFFAAVMASVYNGEMIFVAECPQDRFSSKLLPGGPISQSALRCA